MHWARVNPFLSSSSSSCSVVAASPLQNPHGYHTGRRMDLLWRDYFRDPSPLHSNGSCRSPHLPRRPNHDSLPVSEWCNPSWVLHELSRRSSAVSPPYGGLCPAKHHHREERSFGNSQPNLDGDHDEFALVKLLKVCAKKKDLCEGIRLHADIAQQGGLLDKNPYIASSLISMYAKCGMLSKAQELHDELDVRRIDSWNALIGGFAQQGQGQKALNCFEYMECEGLSPDLITYISILKASGIARCLSKGEQIHGEIVGKDLLSRSVLLGTALVGMYAKCGELSQAFQVLEDLPIRNVFAWNALIAGYGEGEQGYKALDCFKCMRCEGISPDAVTFTCILNVCSSIGANVMGEEIHKEISSHGLLQKDLVLRNALVDMYVKCGMLSKAQELHDDPSFAKNVVTWNALIAGYAQQGQGHKALSCLWQMHAKGLSPDAITYACVLKACGSIGTLHEGEQIHEEIVRRGLLENNIVLATALVDMYVKCGAIAKAQKGLKELRVRSIASWNALLTGYVQHGQGHEAINSFDRVRTEAFSPNAITFTCILNACGRVGAIDMGKQVHDEVVSLGLLRQDAVVGNALVDMYAKCGMIQRAQQVHDELSTRDVVSWNALITGYAHQGQGKEALHCFQLMQREGFSPDGMTLLGVLNACSHCGRFDEAQTYFSSMSCKYGLAPNIEHHTCVIVALGCIGCFDEVMSIISTLPTSYDPPLWLALLNACKKWGNIEVAKLVFAQILRLDKNCAEASYAIMDQIYATAGMHEDACTKG